MERTSPKTHVHFPGLNGLRFFAALAVCASHVELLKQYLGYPSAYDRPAVYEVGRLSVTFFFVLSGYLITYLLLIEKQATGTISLRDFYVRRILRIWPLYYLLMGLSFFVVPRITAMRIPALSSDLAAHAAWTLPLFAFFLPQLALSAFPPVPFGEPAWSIGVEEQFYLVWPILMKRFRLLPAIAMITIAATIAARHAAVAIATTHRSDADALRGWNVVINYLYFTRLECMAIGALAAWIVFHNRRTPLRLMHNRFVQTAVYALTLFLFITPAGKPIFDYGPYAICFAVILVNVSTNRRSLIQLTHRGFDFLGNISFSMYMLHELAIRITLAVITSVISTRFATAASTATLYTVSMLLTIGMATLSYLWFERPFLRLKSKFAVIASSPGGPAPAAPPPLRASSRASAVSR